ncbi:cell division protein PerM [Actinacidiphila guanduensis]|uniref:cell division protein PerM n=1 Tax=Actinacidiphila guanduensis TaxID=310781 RepID=UPI00115FBF4B|nr:DUF6350 family protein [Actinacidiphila guanduensis]
MTHASDRVTPAPAPAAGAAVRGASAGTPAAGAPHWAAVRVSALAAGVAAAGLALGGIAAVVLLLWIGSPFPDSGLGGALHIGADLWLLAQGADLVRTDTLSGDPAPLAIPPLLLSALPAWLVFRGTASAVAMALGRDEDDDNPERPARRRTPRRPAVPLDAYALRCAGAVTGWVLAGYLTPVACAVVYASAGSIHVDLPTAPYVALFAACAAALGAWSGAGRPGADDLRAPRVRRARAYLREAGAAVRAAAIGGGLLLGGAALLGAAALACHPEVSGRSYGHLSDGLVGRFSVLLVAAGLVPNLVVWAAAYTLGTGFSIGAGSIVRPAGDIGYGPLPDFPLLAALPGEGGSWLGWTTLALPGLAALAVAWCVGNGGRSAAGTARVAAEAALVTGGGFAVLAAWAGGPVGAQRLAEFGPAWWSAAGAAAGWVLVLGLPGALLLRYRLAHPPHPWRALLRSARPRLPRQQAGEKGTAPAAEGTARTPGPRGLLPRRARGTAAVPRETPEEAPRRRFGALFGRRTGAGEAAASESTPAAAGPGADPLPWPAPAPLPLFPPPLPDLPPSEPPAPHLPPGPPPVPPLPISDPPPDGPPAGP